MPRRLRSTIPGTPHHVIQRGNNRTDTFITAADHAFYRNCLANAIQRHFCRLHAYVMMTNHIHLLITPEFPGGISGVMQSAGRRYVQRFNRIHGRTGTLWEGQYRATAIDSDRYLLSCYRYIELNPVRAGLVVDPAEYRWSSYGANALGLTDPLVTPHESYSALGGDEQSRRVAYQSLFQETLDDSTLRDIRHATNAGRKVSGERFRQELSLLVKRARL